MEASSIPRFEVVIMDKLQDHQELLQVVSGSISAGVSREWNLLEAEFEFGDLSNISELSIYMGGTPTDSSFYLDEVIITPFRSLCFRCPSCHHRTGEWQQTQGSRLTGKVI